MNAPTRTGRARLLFAAILTGAVVAAGMAPALAAGDVLDVLPVERLGVLAEALEPRSQDAAARLKITAARLDELSGFVPADPGPPDSRDGGGITV